MEAYILKKEDFFGMGIKIPAIDEQHVQLLFELYRMKIPTLNPPFNVLPEVPEGCELNTEYLLKNKKIKSWEIVDSKTGNLLRTRVLKNISETGCNCIETFYENGKKQKVIDVKTGFTSIAHINEYIDDKKSKDYYLIDDKLTLFHDNLNKLCYNEHLGAVKCLSKNTNPSYTLFLDTKNDYVNAVDFRINKYKICVLYDKEKNPYCIFVTENIDLITNLNEILNREIFSKAMIVQKSSSEYKGMKELKPVNSHFHKDLNIFLEKYQNHYIFPKIRWYDKTEEEISMSRFGQNQIKLFTGETYKYNTRLSSEDEEEFLIDGLIG